MPGSTKDANLLPGPSEAGGWTDDGAVVRLTTGTDRVGIGTTNAGSKLNVYTTASEVAGRFEINNASSAFPAISAFTNGGEDSPASTNYRYWQGCLFFKHESWH